MQPACMMERTHAKKGLAQLRKFILHYSWQQNPLEILAPLNNKPSNIPNTTKSLPFVSKLILCTYRLLCSRSYIAHLQSNFLLRMSYEKFCFHSCRFTCTKKQGPKYQESFFNVLHFFNIINWAIQVRVDIRVDFLGTTGVGVRTSKLWL